MFSAHDTVVHTQNETMVAGSAFAISYTSNLTEVTDENLVVFTVLEQFVSLHLFTFDSIDQIYAKAPPGSAWRPSKSLTYLHVLKEDASVP